MSSQFIATLHSKHIFWDSWDNIFFSTCAPECFDGILNGERKAEHSHHLARHLTISQSLSFLATNKTILSDLKRNILAKMRSSVQGSPPLGPPAAPGRPASGPGAGAAAAPPRPRGPAPAGTSSGNNFCLKFSYNLPKKNYQDVLRKSAASKKTI